MVTIHVAVFAYATLRRVGENSILEKVPFGSKNSKQFQSFLEKFQS